jgi:tetratricopeptide (TPR) repeat protein
LPEAQQQLARNPDDAGAVATFGRWYAFRGQEELALAFLEKARKAGGEVSSLELARCYWRLGQRDEAEHALQSAIEAKEAPEDYLRLCLAAVRRR